MTLASDGQKHHVEGELTGHFSRGKKAWGLTSMLRPEVSKILSSKESWLFISRASAPSIRSCKSTSSTCSCSRGMSSSSPPPSSPSRDSSALPKKANADESKFASAMALCPGRSAAQAKSSGVSSPPRNLGTVTRLRCASHPERALAWE
eukprot:scaffold1033_cov408-Prasinococcus_capsulatus_cf.AAC.5